MTSEARSEFPAWVRFKSYKQISFVGKEAVAFGKDTHILISHLESGKESFYVANSKLNGDGVACIAGHSIFPILAFAESCPKARIFVISYPEMAKISVFCHSPNPESFIPTYNALCFSETEHLIALTGMPTYQTQIWYWRSMEMLALAESAKNQCFIEDQILGCGTALPPVVCQMGYKEGKFWVWELHGTVKLCKMIKRKINLTLEPEECPLDFSFAIDGTFYIVNKAGTVYHIYPVSGQINQAIQWESETKNLPTSITCVQNGVLVSGPDGNLKLFKKQKGNYQNLWEFTPPEQINSLAYNPNTETVLATTLTGALYKIQTLEDKATCSLLKEYEKDIKFFGFLNPLAEHVVLISNANILSTLIVESGEKVSSMNLKDYTCVIEHPRFPFILIGDKEGILILIKFLQPARPEVETEFHLTTHNIKLMRFSPSGDYLVVLDVNKEIFLLSTPIGGRWDVIHQVPDVKPVNDLCLFESPSELTILGLIPAKKDYISKLLLHISLSLEDVQIYSTNEIKRSEHFFSISILPTLEGHFVATEFKTQNFRIYKLSENTGDIEVVQEIPSPHIVACLFCWSDANHILTFGLDGQICVYDVDKRDLLKSFTGHNRFQDGVLSAKCDPFTQYVISLGHSQSLACTKLNSHPLNKSKQNSLIEAFEGIRHELESPTIGFIPVDEYEGLRWPEVQARKKLKEEEEMYASERSEILANLQHISTEVSKLLDTNLTYKESERIEMDAFILDDVWMKDIFDNADKEREAYEKRIQEEINEMAAVNMVLIEECWDTMEVKGAQLKGIFSHNFVDNYPIKKGERNQEPLNHVMFRRKLELLANLSDNFEYWLPVPANELEQTLGREPDMKPIDFDLDAYLDSLPENYQQTGTTTHKFIKPNRLRFHQYDVITRAQIDADVIFGKQEIVRLREYLNKDFAELQKDKESTMKTVIQINSRLKYIREELKVLADLKKEDFVEDEDIVDPTYAPEEKPEEMIIQIHPWEVKAKPYVSPSKQKLLDTEEAEKERKRLEMLADDFKERTLMDMMDGVLEHRWEDEIKKPLKAPSVITEKDPSVYTEEDVAIVKEYEEKVRRTLADREKYQKSLEEERDNLKKTRDDRIMSFNVKIAKLEAKKIEIDFAINSEEIRILNFLNYIRIMMQFDQKEEDIKSEIEKAKENLQKLNDTLSEIQEKIAEFKSNYESLNTKDRMLDKQFKENFGEVAPIAVVDPAYKIFKRRPKYQIRAWATVPILLELAKRIVSRKPAEQNALLLPNECTEYMTLLDQMDVYVTGATGIDPNVWQVLCRMRRAKIESEFKLKAFGLQLAEADGTANAFNKEIYHKKNNLAALEQKWHDLIEEKLSASMNRTIHLVMPCGQVEIELTGDMKDFDDVILIPKSDIDEINQVIRKAGQKKIKAMENAAIFRRKVLLKEWEHKALEMTLEDLQEQLKWIEGLKVTKDIQEYLKDLNEGRKPDYSDEAAEQAIKNQEKINIREINKLMDRIKELEAKLEAQNIANSKLDDEIQAVNLELSTRQLERDLEFEEKHDRERAEVMRAVVERSRTLRRIQEQHAEIMELTAILELQKLKTYPTLNVPCQFK